MGIQILREVLFLQLMNHVYFSFSSPETSSLSELSVSTVDGDMFAAAIKVFKQARNLEQARLALDMMEECAYSENVARSISIEQRQQQDYPQQHQWPRSNGQKPRGRGGRHDAQATDLLATTSMGNLSQAYGAVAAMCASATPFADANLAIEIIFDRMPSVVPKHTLNLRNEDMAVCPDLDVLNSALLACARAELQRQRASEAAHPDCRLVNGRRQRSIKRSRDRDLRRPTIRQHQLRRRAVAVSP